MNVLKYISWLLSHIISLDLLGDMWYNVNRKILKGMFDIGK